MNLEIEGSPIYNQLLTQFKESAHEFILGPYYRLNFNAKLDAINERILEAGDDKNLVVFLNNLKDLLLSKEISKKNDLDKMQLLASFHSLFPNIGFEKLKNDLDTLPDDYNLTSLLNLFSKYQKESSPELLEALIKASIELQGNYKNIMADEDSRNKYISTILTMLGFIPKDQSRWGQSRTGKSQGELDIKIENRVGQIVGILEGLNLQSLDTAVIDLHLNKLFGYDPNGLKNNYIVVYSSAKNFIDLWRKYLSYIYTITFKYPMIKDPEDISIKVSQVSNIKVALAFHARNEEIAYVYHIFINLNF